MLTFAYAWVFFLAPLPLIIWWLVPAASETRPSVRVPFLPRLMAAAEGASIASTRGSGLRFLSSCLVWLLILGALARPQRLEPPIERTIPTRDLLLLVDLSASMGQADFTNKEGQSVDRLTAVKGVLDDFLARREGDRVGLVVFGNAPFLQAPFTTDLELCRQLLNETAVGMAGPRTALGDAIGLGISLFDESDAPTKTIIALTDGNDTGSGVPPAEAARIAKDREITIHTVAVGDPTTIGEEKLDQESLQDVSKATGGDYFLALNRDELAGIYERLDEIETRETKTVSHRPRSDLYFWPLATALLLSLVTHLIRLIAARAIVSRSTIPVRLRVNARTFELEAVEQ
ncbi:VWA domain-containing protein [Adhaeretor mobilis]|uniref:von Willebrand factor type A domain protein n=1 Tax=Adhaeretor mobilis TaxID=1930276 RepID=A0A517MST8_9BACT|nr:VWA domain-containing protein [Adhaeretor mobilis]QDS97956.1 von Willebrand factor type A domain protein [Adhaeretor mobilis]